MEVCKKLAHLYKYHGNVHIYLFLEFGKLKALYLCTLIVALYNNLHIETFFVQVCMYYFVQLLFYYEYLY